ncbi:MAG TPA: AI-2E family transporter [Streptosporangiaceae bacterium]|jgi:predicted PurR-regulated permease PerM
MPWGIRLAKQGWRRTPAAPGDAAGDASAGDASAGASGEGARRPERPDDGSASHRQVPALLQLTAGWAWRLLIVGLLVYVLARVASALRIVVLPCVAALLLTALLQPLTGRLKRAGLPAMLATWCALLAAIAVIAGLGALIGVRASQEFPTLQSDLTHTGHKLQSWLAGPPFHIKQARLQQLLQSAENEIASHKSLVAGTVLTGGKYITEIAAGTILTLFVSFFLIKDGDRIWHWLTGFMSADTGDRVNRAGNAAWQVLVHYVRGTVLIAATHSVIIGLTLWILGVPLVIPLAAVVFLAAFVPLIGILFAGVLSILITLGTKGVVAAVILLVVFLVEDQLDGHLLQPQIVGRIIRLHPLAVILVLAVGGVLAGVPGAVVAVPTAAAAARAWPELRRAPDAAGAAEPDGTGAAGPAGPDGPDDVDGADDAAGREPLGDEHVPM